MWLAAPLPALSQASNSTDYKLNLGLEYMYPTKDNRVIETVSIHAVYGWEWLEKTPLTIGVGITGTYAWGHIVQLDDNLNDTRFDNSAWGVGPVFTIKYEPFVYHGFSVSPDFSGGIILYSENFPSGGDVYNFMWRIGGSVNYHLPNGNTGASISCKWMHVSNGQGLVPHNPSYEGLGVELSVFWYLIKPSGENK